jgi:succinate dehydrogenase/fumarate reductase-like Fe-S protein
MFADTGTIAVLNKLSTQMQKMVKLQETIVDILTTIQKDMTGDTTLERYRRNEVCTSDCTHYGGVEF